MSSKTTSTQESKPPAWAQPLFEQSAQEASNIYNSGAGGNPYLGSAVSDLSGTTMQGVNQLANAGQNWDTSGTRSLYGGIGANAVNNPFMSQLSNLAGGVNPQQVGTGMFNPAQGAASGLGNYAQQLFGGVSGGQNGINTEGDWRNILNSAGQPTAADQYLTSTAQGDFLKGSPYLDDIVSRSAGEVADQTNNMFAAGGRYGSGANQGVVSDSVARTTNELMNANYQSERDRQLAASGMIDQSRQGSLASQMGAASGITGVQGQNIANQMAASGQMLGAQTNMADLLRSIGEGQANVLTGDANRSLQGQALQGDLLGQAGQFYGQGLDQAQRSTDAMAGLDQQNFQNQLQGAQATLGAGGILDEQSQKMLTDEISKYYELDNADWQRLGMLQSAAGGAAGGYGTQSGTSRTSNPAAILGGLGGLFSGK